MPRIDQIDPNFRAPELNVEKLKMYDIMQEPFRIYGVYRPDDDFEFIRMPREVAEKVNNGVKLLNNHTSGGRVRFSSNSEYVYLKCTWENMDIFAHMPASGSAGFDMYVDGKFCGLFRPAHQWVEGYRPYFDCDKGFEAVVHFETREQRDIIINFPLYNRVSTVEIGLEEDATLLPGKEYKHKKPVVFYGSSITQGGCASRPGNMYQAVLSRRLDFDYINLGFSGNARAEDPIAEYIASLDMSVFVYDYDHNAYSLEYLEKTHYPMYQKIRAAQPDLPIIMMSRPSVSPLHHEEEVQKRINIIQQTYDKAVAAGDKNIYFINSMKEVFPLLDPEMMTVDGSHPTDLGFYCMAHAVEKILRPLLGE